MAAKKASRATSKKLKDKWRAKQWYTITAPEIFDSREVPATPADDPSKLMGRVVEVTMQELTSDFSKSNIKLKFRINRIAGFEAKTVFVGHELTSDYIRRLTRRRRTKVDGIFDVTTKDGYRIRVKPMAIADHRIQSSQKSALRKIMNEVVVRKGRGMLMGEFVNAVISGELSRDIFQSCKPIYRLKRIDIRRSDILGRLSTHKKVEGEPEDIDAIPEEEEEQMEGPGEMPEVPTTEESEEKEETGGPEPLVEASPEELEEPGEAEEKTAEAEPKSDVNRKEG